MKIVPIKRKWWQKVLDFFKSERRLAEEYLARTMEAIKKEQEKK